MAEKAQEIFGVQKGTCSNCKHKNAKSTFDRCVKCLNESKVGNQFPEWEKEVSINVEGAQTGRFSSTTSNISEKEKVL